MRYRRSSTLSTVTIRARNARGVVEQSFNAVHVDSKAASVHDYVSNTVGRNTIRRNTRGFSEPSCTVALFHDESHSRTTSHPSVARHWLPREIDVISRGLRVITSLRPNESNSNRLEERISSSRFFSFLKETLLPRQRAGCQGGGRKRDTPRVSDVASNF